MDMSEKVRWLSVGYSPKIHDGQYVMLNRYEFDHRFSGGVIIGDEHYQVCRQLQDPQILAPFRASAHLTRAQQKYNDRLRIIRARVETPFAWLKRTFKSLDHAWRYSMRQLDFLVTYAVAAWNLSL